MSPAGALDALFRENELPMSDRNGVLYDTIRTALAEAEAPKAEPVAQRPIDLDDRGPVFTLPHPPAPTVREEIFYVYPGIDGKRMWWSGGTWLYPGDAIVVRRA